MDSSCQDSFDLNAKILEESMKNPQLKEKPLLIFANKQDRVTSNFSLKEIENKLQLNEKKYGNSCQLFSCSAKNTSKNHQKIDEKIEKGLEWLFEEIQQNFHTLDERVKKDVKEKKEQNEKRKIEQRARVATWKEERERNQMSQHDIPQYRYPSMMMKTITSEDDGVVMKCSNCNTKPAETKCAASKWMPVCSDCAIILKAQAAKEAEAAVASQANAIKCTNCTIKPAETKCAASKWMPVCGDCATELRNKAATAATVPLETNK
jgi:ADP-ribosylation factor-like protein 13B